MANKKTAKKSTKKADVDEAPKAASQQPDHLAGTIYTPAPKGEPTRQSGLTESQVTK